MKPYPTLGKELLSDVIRTMEFIIKERKTDVKDFDNLTQTFILGRKVGKIPSGATDVTALDKAGDFNIADDAGTTYLYALVNIGGTGQWRRVAMSSW